MINDQHGTHATVSNRLLSPPFPVTPILLLQIVLRKKDIGTKEFSSHPTLDEEKSQTLLNCLVWWRGSLKNMDTVTMLLE